MRSRLDRLPVKAAKGVGGAVCFVLFCAVGCSWPDRSGTTRPADAEMTSRADIRQAGDCVEQARSARRAGRPESARSLLEKAVTLAPADGTAHHLLGLVCFELGDLYSAAVHLDLAAKLLNDRFEPCYNLGCVLEGGGQYEQAMRSYERALTRRIDHLESIENLARVRIKAGYRDEETLRLLTRCLDRERRPEWSQWLQQEAARLRGSVGAGHQTVSLSDWGSPAWLGIGAPGKESAK